MDQTPRRYNLIPPLASAVTCRIPAAVAGIILIAAYLAIWLVRKTYTALDDDAHLYALQALARLKPQMHADLFLAYGSQDSYTVFTPFYAWLIGKIGLASAASSLTLMFHAWSATAVWYIARRFTTADLAWLTTGVVLVIPGIYGALGVFEYAETFFTARLPAETFVLTSIALILAEKRWLAWLFVALSLLVHPIVSAPGIVLLVWLASTPQSRQWLLAAGLTACATVVVATYLGFIPGLRFMDAAWLEVIRERSLFMFVENWKGADWDWLLLSFLTLIFVAVVNDTRAIKDTAVAAALVGAAGVALAAITSLAPVEIVIKGQPWRWTWLSTYIAVITFVPTWATCWNRGGLARLACVLVYSSWVFPLIWSFPNLIAAPIAGLALLVYCLRDRIAADHLKYFKWLTLGVAGMAAVAVVMTTIPLLQLDFTTNRESQTVETARNLAALALPAVAVVLAVWLATVRLRLAASALAIAALVVAALATLVPSAYTTWTGSPYQSAYASFAQWRTAIDHRRDVLWLSSPVPVWLLLDSPAYLSTSQSAGVVFSRETALEVQRRAAALAPLVGRSRFAINKHEPGRMQALTTDILGELCSDPRLGYVVSADKLDMVRRAAPKGRWSGVYLYSCDDLHPPHS